MVRPSKTTLILTFRYKHNILRHIDLELAVTRASSRWYSVTTIFMASGHSNLVPWPQVVLHFSVQGKRPRKKKNISLGWFPPEGWMDGDVQLKSKRNVYPGRVGCMRKSARALYISVRSMFICFSKVSYTFLFTACLKDTGSNFMERK